MGEPQGLPTIVPAGHLTSVDFLLYSCTYLVLQIKKVMCIPVSYLVCVLVRVCVFCLCLCLDLSCTTGTPFGTVDQAISCKKKNNLPDVVRARERERERVLYNL